MTGGASATVSSRAGAATVLGQQSAAAQPASAKIVPAIVNVARIRELRPYSSREYAVILNDGTRLRLSRRYRDRRSGP